MTGTTQSSVSWGRGTDGEARLLVKEEADMTVSCWQVDERRSGTGTCGKAGTVTRN